MERKKLETALMAGIVIALLGILAALIAQNLKEVDARSGWAEEEPAGVVTAKEPVAAIAEPEPEIGPEPEIAEERANSYPLTDEEFYAVCAVVMAESGAEPYEGQMAVAWCIRNACELDHVDPIYVLERYGYTKPKSTWTESVSKAVNAVFWQGEKVVDEPVRYFCAPKLCEGSWHERDKEFVCEIGGHRFFK